MSKIFGLSQLELIEDALQDTFLQASLKWRHGQPDDPEAWLTRAARNRVIDLLRQVKSRKDRDAHVANALSTEEINEFFQDHELVDSQLRMIFVACHPIFSAEEQIAFALKTISGFSMKEIAAALVQKEETVKKRLSRARKKIREAGIELEYPSSSEIGSRMAAVQQVIYLIFNEGFQSTKPDSLIDKSLCGEALRLCKLLLLKEKFRSGSLYALFALLCYHSARLDTRIVDGKLVDLKNQDRSKWHLPLIVMGNKALERSLSYQESSSYHFEALIASEHVRAVAFERTDWSKIVGYYEEMLRILNSDQIRLSLAVALLQDDQASRAKEILDEIDQDKMLQRKYLLYGAYSELYQTLGQPKRAVAYLEKALLISSNVLERQYLLNKLNSLRS